MNQLEPPKVERLKQALADGKSIRVTAREVGVNRNTVLRYWRNLCATGDDDMPREMSDDARCHQVSIAVSRAELERINEYCRACGALSRAELLRSIILDVVADDAAAHRPRTALDMTIERLLVLWGTRSVSSDEIARAIGMSEAFVTRVLDAWRDERANA